MSSATLAAKADVCTEPVHKPLGSATGMGSPEPDDVAQE
jgi:hypothetical protein